MDSSPVELLRPRAPTLIVRLNVCLGSCWHPRAWAVGAGGAVRRQSYRRRVGPEQMALFRLQLPINGMLFAKGTIMTLTLSRLTRKGPTVVLVISASLSFSLPFGLTFTGQSVDL